MRDASSDIQCRLIRTNYATQTTAPATTADIVFRNSTTDNYHRTMSNTAFSTWCQNAAIKTADSAKLEGQTLAQVIAAAGGGSAEAIGNAVSPNTLVLRDSTGDSWAYRLRTINPNDEVVPSSTSCIAFRDNSTTSNYTRWMTQTAFSTWLQARNIKTGDSAKLEGSTWGSVAASIAPSATVTYSLGNSTRKWYQIWGGSITGSSFSLDGANKYIIHGLKSIEGEVAATTNLENMYFKNGTAGEGWVFKSGVTPVFQITSAGDMHSAGIVAATFSDLAENYMPDQEIEAGSVVSLGGDEEITISTIDMDTMVAGIISSKPGFLLNQNLEGGAPLALKGRVPCKVQGDIKRGDLLVSAGNGRARAEENPRVGSLIAKAMEDSTGIAVIEVLVA